MTFSGGAAHYFLTGGEMIKIIKEKDFRERLNNRYDGGGEGTISDTVQKILSDVKKGGDDALRRLTKEFDKVDRDDFVIKESEIKAAYDLVEGRDPSLIAALKAGKDRIEKFSKRQRESFTDFEMELETALFAGQKIIPVDRAGVYIPSGRYPLVSSVLMNLIPAQIAGVRDIVLCTPPLREGEFGAHPNILSAAYLCGVKKVFSIGGAQAIAAMAYGTKTVPKCCVITGPGNAFVAEAKKQVFGTVGLDMVAGPTEVLIIADDRSDKRLVAADLLAQAEHDTRAAAVALVNSEDFALDLKNEIDAQLNNLSTKDVAQRALDQNGAIVLCDNLDSAAEIANIFSPEHLELSISDKSEEKRIAAAVHNYGSLFISPCCEVLGDYSAGINHTLPTMGGSRFTGGLSVRVFLKTVTTLRCEGGDLSSTAAIAATLARAEGLDAHRAAAVARC